MLVIGESSNVVQVECNLCRARQTLPRFTSELASGRVRSEPEEGQWIPCMTCHDWSPLERPAITGSGSALAGAV